MSDANLERIVIMLQAKDRDFARAMDRSNKLIAKLSREGQRDTTQLTRTVNSRLDEMAASALSFGRAFAAGLAGSAVAAAMGFLSNGLRQTVRGIAAVGDEARRAGVGVEAFQEWAFVAQQNRIGVDQLIDGLKELNLRADEFVVTGAGPAAEAFQRLGYTAEELRRGLADPSELLLEIIGRMQRLNTAAQIRVADEVFGGSAGERFVELLSQGEDGLRRTRDMAHEVGAVMGEAMIRQADEVDRRFNQLATRLGQLGREVVVGWSYIYDDVVDALTTSDAEALLAPLEARLDRVAVEARDAQFALQRMADLAGEMGSSALQAAFVAISDAIRNSTDALDEGTLQADDYRESLDRILGAAETALSASQSINGVDLSSAIAVVAALRGELVDLRDQAALTAAQVAAATMTPARQVESFWDTEEPRFGAGRFAPRSSPRPRRAPALLGEPEVPSGSGTGGGSGSSRYGAAVEDITASVRALDLEAAALVAAAGSGREYGDAIEYARLRAQLMNDALADGREITPQLQAEIDALAESYLTAGRSVDQAREAMDRVREDAKRGADAFLSIFEAIGQGSDAARAAVARLLAQMASAQFARFLDGLGATGGGGGVLSFIGRLLGRAGGGGVQAGVPYRINENTPNSEVFVPSRSGGVLNVSQAKSALAGQSGGAMAITVNVTGASGDDHVIALVHQGVRQGLAAYDRALPGRVRGLNPRRA